MCASFDCFFSNFWLFAKQLFKLESSDTHGPPFSPSGSTILNHANPNTNTVPQLTNCLQRINLSLQQARTLEATSYLNSHQVKQSRWVLHFCGCTFYIPEELSISASMASVHDIRVDRQWNSWILCFLPWFTSLIHWWFNLISPSKRTFLREKKSDCLCSSNETALQFMRDCWILLQHSVAATSLDNWWSLMQESRRGMAKPRENKACTARGWTSLELQGFCGAPFWLNLNILVPCSANGTVNPRFAWHAVLAGVRITLQSSWKFN